MENKKGNPTVNRYFFLLIIILFAVSLLWSLLDFFTAFLGAVMFYVLSKPLVDWLMKRWKWRKSWCATLVILISFFIILLPIGLLITMLYGKIVALAQNPTAIIQPVKNFGQLIEMRYHINLVNSSLAGIQSVATHLISAILNTSFNMFTTICMMYFFSLLYDSHHQQARGSHHALFAF